MHIVFQFPIVDLRIIKDAKSKLLKPLWPSPSLNKQPFIRNFGKVMKRNKGGLASWPAEENYCKAHIIKYHNLHEAGYQIDQSLKASIFNSYRRFYSDGQFMNKVELGFIDNMDKLLNTRNSLKVNLINILKHFCNLPVTINEIPTKLFKGGELIAHSYFNASTPRKIDKGRPKNIVAGDPVIIISYTARENLQIPRYSRKIMELSIEGQKVNLFGYKLHHGGYFIKVWLLELPPPGQITNSQNDILRKLRINLLRIHAEKETVRILMNNTKASKLIEEDVQRISFYLKNIQKKLFQKKRFGIEQTSILEFALQSEDVADPGSLTTLENEVSLFQDKYARQNSKKLSEAMAKDDAILLLFITGSSISLQPLDFGDEYSRILEAHDKSIDKGNFKLDLRTSVKKEQLSKILEELRPGYVHFTMHGIKKEGLCFSSESRQSETMSVEEFSSILQEVSSKCNWKPEIILLNVCNSKPFSDASRTLCQYAVGMKTVWPEDAGAIYTGKFYKSLFGDNQNNIPKCHEMAIDEIKDGPRKFQNIKFENENSEPWLKNIKEIEVYNIPEIVHS